MLFDKGLSEARYEDPLATRSPAPPDSTDEAVAGKVDSRDSLGLWSRNLTGFGPLFCGVAYRQGVLAAWQFLHVDKPSHWSFLVSQMGPTLASRNPGSTSLTFTFRRRHSMHACLLPGEVIGLSDDVRLNFRSANSPGWALTLSGAVPAKWSPC